MGDSFGTLPFVAMHHDAPKAPSVCQAMDGAGLWLQFDEVDGSLCATVAGWRWKCIFKTRLRLLHGHV